MYRATFEFRTSLKKSEVYQRDEVLGKASAMRGELRTSRNAVEYSETAGQTDGRVRILDTHERPTESMRTKKPMKPCKHGRNV